MNVSCHTYKWVTAHIWMRACLPWKTSGEMSHVTHMNESCYTCEWGVRVWVSSKTLHHTTIHCNTLQPTATHCNTLQTSGEISVSTYVLVELRRRNSKKNKKRKKSPDFFRDHASMGGSNHLTSQKSARDAMYHTQIWFSIDNLGLFCHVPLKRDQWEWDWRLRWNDTLHAITYDLLSPLPTSNPATNCDASRTVTCESLTVTLHMQ